MSLLKYVPGTNEDMISCSYETNGAFIGFGISPDKHPHTISQRYSPMHHIALHKTESSMRITLVNYIQSYHNITRSNSFDNY